MHFRQINDFLPLLPPKILLLTPSLATTGGRRIHPSLHPQDLNPEDKKAMTFFIKFKEIYIKTELSRTGNSSQLLMRIECFHCCWVT